MFISRVCDYAHLAIILTDERKRLREIDLHMKLDEDANGRQVEKTKSRATHLFFPRSWCVCRKSNNKI
jgi:hypothetical protein